MAALEELLELDELAKLLELDDAGEELLELLTELAELTADELLKELIALLEVATGIIKALLDELEELTEAIELLELEELTEAKELLELASAPFSTLLELAELELEELAWSGLLFINSSMPALSLSLHAVRAAARQPMAARREQMVNDPLIGIDIPFVESCMRVRT